LTLRDAAALEDLNLPAKTASPQRYFEKRRTENGPVQKGSAEGLPQMREGRWLAYTQ
jgi:hypothetical protein